MPYIGHAPTNAGQFVLLDDIQTTGSPGGTFNGTLDTFNMKVSSVSVSPSADNLLIMLSGIVQETPGSYTVSGSTIVFDDAPETGMTFYGILMGQSASVGAGTVNEASLEISNAGSNGQYLQKQSANTGGLTWATVDTSTLAPLASPDLTGNPTAPTQSASNNSTRIATTAYADTAVSNLVDSAPAALDTLNELAAALGDDASFSTTVTNSIAAKLPLAGGTMTGNIVMADDTSIGISDSDERIEFDGAGDISLLGCNVGIGTASPAATSWAAASPLLQLSGTQPILSLDETDGTEWSFAAHGGKFRLYDSTDSADRFAIDTDGNVGIGTASPIQNLQVAESGALAGIYLTTYDTGASTSTFTLAKSDHNTIGTYATTDANDVLGTLAWRGVGSGAAGFNIAGSIQVKQTGVGGTTYIPGDMTFTVSTDTDQYERMRIRSDGFVGIGTDSPGNDAGYTATTLDVNGYVQGNTILIGSGIEANDTYVLRWDGNTGTKSFFPLTDNRHDLGNSIRRWDDVYATNSSIQTSDRNLKENITDSSLGLDFLTQLRPVEYKWKDYTAPAELIDEFEASVWDDKNIGDERHPAEEKTYTRTHYGLIAQEVEEVLTDMGMTTEQFAPIVISPKNENDTLEEAIASEEITYSMRYGEYVGILIKAIQELSAKVEALENE